MAGYQEADEANDLFGDDDFDTFDEIFGVDGAGDMQMDEGFGPAEPSNAIDTLPPAVQSNENDELPPSEELGDANDLANIMREAGMDPEDVKIAELNEHVLVPGEKAEDAIDYEDFEDDDLPEEEVATGHSVQDSYGPAYGSEDAAAPDDATQPIDDTDDLFNATSPLPGDDDVDMSSFITAPAPIAAADAVSTPMAGGDDGDKDSLASEHDDAHNEKPSLSDMEAADTEDAKLYLLQKALFDGKPIPETQEQNLDAWVRLEFPDYNKDELPYFSRLFPPRPSRYRDGKRAPKPPKPIRPTKVNLDIEPDQRLLFNAVSVTGHVEPRKDLVEIRVPKNTRDSDDSDGDSDGDEPLPGGYTMQDLEYLCADFDTLSHQGDSEDGFGDLHVRIMDAEGLDTGDSEYDDFEHTRKKRKTGFSPHDIVSIHQINVRSLDNPERLTAKLANQTVLNLNDPRLLVEEIDPEAAKVKAKPGVKTKGVQTISKRLNERFNTSNDTEYDLLNQNRQRGVRGQLGHDAVDHSMPALRLQYPYYQVQLSTPELRNWHRSKMRFKGPFTFSKPNKYKRKGFKGKQTKEIFNRTKDLSLGDNSTAVLFEYSEEHPIMVSSTGMGNSIINYYRKKTFEDTTRPKHDIGELNVLLEGDRSPFNHFGHVDAGQEVTALVNSMYSAPLFEQPLKPQDFLIVRETTGLEGQRYYVRNVDSTFVVGQELPIKQVPGVHSRNVTSASKYRLRAIAYRIARRKKSHRIKVEDVTQHFPESTDMQNRQKMKEFMSFNKEYKEWEMAKGHDILTEEQIQEQLKPEDIALLEAKDVGAQYVRDSGYGDDDYGDDDEERAGEPFEQQMAPWKTTKNFVQAAGNRAMLRLYGDGDPSGRGEAISFLKTSMKGGFRAMGGPVNDTVQSKKELGGHQYNVAKQNLEYEEALRKIWKKQKDALSSKEPPTDPALEGDVDTQADNMLRQSMRAPSMGTPASARRVDEETGTSFSRRSGTSQSQRFLKITRMVKVKGGGEVEQTTIETNPAIIKAYIKRKELHAAANIEYFLHSLSLAFADKSSIQQIVGPTGDAEVDARNQEKQVYLPCLPSCLLTRSRLQAELDRLQNNRIRNKKRASKKKATEGEDGVTSPGGESTPAGKESKPTVRKCANCGQVGHIKTNKKSVKDPKCTHCGLSLLHVQTKSSLALLPPGFSS